jgi:hypothetical protein
MPDPWGKLLENAAPPHPVSSVIDLGNITILISRVWPKIRVLGENISPTQHFKETLSATNAL